MIVDTRRADVFSGPELHIAFAVNTAGINDSGFAGTVAARYWPELATVGPHKMGTVLSHVVGPRAYHAMVCHSLGEGGWEITPDAVGTCLDHGIHANGAEIAVTLVGGGPVGAMGGADTFAILGGIARSKQRCVVYTL